MIDIKKDSLYEALAGCCLQLRLTGKEELQLETSADFLFPADFVGFAGHFPGNPILPAIVQLAVVRFLMERALGQGVVPAFYQKIKFKGQIRPGDLVTVKIAIKNHGVKRGGKFSLSRPDGETIAGGLVEFAFFDQ